MAISISPLLGADTICKVNQIANLLHPASFPKKLLIPQGLNWVKLRGAPRRIHPEHQADKR
ncbi:MAG: hypothetical protein KGS46_20890, partial [Chloroflexi bacterium]|nr:hypothetical protein [Chloroflexota bacterium]